MKNVSIASQIFSLLIVATMMSSAFFSLHFKKVKNYMAIIEFLYGQEVSYPMILPKHGVMYLNKDNMDY